MLCLHQEVESPVHRVRVERGAPASGLLQVKNKRVLNGGQGRGGHLLPEPHPGVGTGGPCFWRSVADTKEQR